MRGWSSTRRACRSSRSALGLVPDTDVRMAQVIRDPRAVVYSWKRKRAFTDREGEDLPRFGAAVLDDELARPQPRRRDRSVAAGQIEIVQYDADGARSGRRAPPARRVRRRARGRPRLPHFGDRDARADALGRRQPRPHDRAARSRSSPTRSGARKIEPRDRFVGTLLALPLLRRYGLPVRSGQALRRRRAAGRRPGRPGPSAPPVKSRPGAHHQCLAALRRHPARPRHRANRRPCSRSAPASGALGAWMAAQYDYTGVELDDGVARDRRRRLAAVGRGQIVEQLADVGDRDFDLVCAFEVLEHINDDGEALEQWREYLRPGGWLLLSVPAHQAQYALVRRARRALPAVRQDASSRCSSRSPASKSCA